ncbi:hypothetical protein GCM10023193_26430 [Planotetraspora kaengkrachanensis]|uniref:Uncharacterized protein n=1 Tax=Planotetraspora kaengkrachanensis TaxID=575193 RepID=A0A8J3LXM5_9ACTN|nr:hypothetical protein Pka01_14550 [Planotetraspora kaengkrachanensis]
MGRSARVPTNLSMITPTGRGRSAGVSPNLCMITRRGSVFVAEAAFQVTEELGVVVGALRSLGPGRCRRHA